MIHHYSHVWGLSVTIPSDVAQDMLDSIPLHSSMTFSNALVETQRAVIQLLAKRHSVMSGDEFTPKRLFLIGIALKKKHH